MYSISALFPLRYRSTVPYLYLYLYLGVTQLQAAEWVNIIYSN